MASQLDYANAARIAAQIVAEQPDIMATDSRGFFVHGTTKAFKLYEACNRVMSAYCCGDRASARDLKLIRVA
jgi:hypothetical protein